jgi:Na+/H+ antiporter NhaB
LMSFWLSLWPAWYKMTVIRWLLIRPERNVVE